MNGPSSYVSPRVSAAAPTAVPQTARQTRSVMPVAMQSPRLNAQQIIFWPTAQTVRSLPLASPHGVSPRQIPSAGDPLRFLGSGYPPRQMVTARQGADRGRDARDVRDALTSYVPHEVKGMKPLTTKVFGPPKVILPVQEAKRSYPILRSFSGAGKEVAESPRDVVETEGGMTPISKEAPKPSLSVAGTPATPAMASATSAASSASIASLVAPGQRQVAVATSSPTAVAAVAIASSTAPAATVVPTPVPVTAEVAKASTPAASQSSLPSDVQPAAESQTAPAPAASQETLRFRWPAGSSTPSKAPFAGNLWPGAVATTAPCRVISARLQPRVISPEAVNSSPRNEGMEKDGANESNDSDAIFPTSGTPAAPAASAPVSMVPAPVISRAGTYTPPHFEMFRSISTQSDMRQRSPRSRLGVTVRNLSPKTRGVAGGLLISPSPLSVSSRQPLAPRRSGSPLSSKALQDLHVRSPAPQASPMTRQRTLPGNLQPERSSTTILTTQSSTAPLEAAVPSPGVSTGASTVELITEKPPARAVGEGRASEIYRRRWRRPSNPAIPHPTDPPGTAHHDGNDFTPAFVRLQEKLSYLAEEGTVSL